MSALNALKTSSWFVPAWDLPLGRGHGNPHIYLAYQDLVLRLHGERINPATYRAFYDACEIEPGLFTRWPDRTSFGVNSHDEVMGAAHLNVDVAKRVLFYLDQNDGNFNSLGRKHPNPERFNIYRMVWLRPYLAACAEYRVGTLGQLLWAAYTLLKAWKDTQSARVGPGPRLRIWLMGNEMRRFPICRLALAFWAYRMKRARIGLRSDLRQEPKFKELTELAPEEYRWPE